MGYLLGKGPGEKWGEVFCYLEDVVLMFLNQNRDCGRKEGKKKIMARGKVVEIFENI